GRRAGRQAAELPRQVGGDDGRQPREDLPTPPRARALLRLHRRGRPDARQARFGEQRLRPPGKGLLDDRPGDGRLRQPRPGDLDPRLQPPRPDRGGPEAPRTDRRQDPALSHRHRRRGLPSHPRPLSPLRLGDRGVRPGLPLQPRADPPHAGLRRDDRLQGLPRGQDRDDDPARRPGAAAPALPEPGVEGGHGLPAPPGGRRGDRPRPRAGGLPVAALRITPRRHRLAPRSRGRHDRLPPRPRPGSSDESGALFLLLFQPGNGPLSRSAPRVLHRVGNIQEGVDEMSKKIPGFAILGVVGFLLLTPTVARAQMGSGTGSTGAGNGMGTGTSAEPNALKPESAAMSDKELETFDRKFLIDAARGGMLEVQAGQLAVERAASPDVKAFGQRMVDDHGKANERLKQVATQYGVALPSDLTKSQKATLDRLSKLSGPEFDKAYIQDMVG